VDPWVLSARAPVGHSADTRANLKRPKGSRVSKYLTFSDRSGRTDARRTPDTKELPLRPGRAAAAVIALSLLVGIARPAQAAPGASALAAVGGLGRLTPLESPAQRIARLRSQAAKVQRTIDKMNNQVEVLVERYNANREALARTQTAQARTQRRIERARRELAGARKQLDQRVWAIYTGGTAVSSLAELLTATDLHEALTTAKYQEDVVAADHRTFARVERAKHALDVLAGQLAAQWRAQAALQTQLGRERRQIEGRLAAQRAYLTRLTAAVRRALEEERRRQEELRRRAIARRLAAQRAARLRAARRAAEVRRQGWAAGAGGTVRSPANAAQRAVAFALRQLGKPYQWGATGPDTYDCSGLTQAAYRHAGVAIPRVSAAQWNAGPHIGMDQLRVGDLVFFATNLSDPSTIHHVGMYIGRGLMVEAPFTGAVVRISSIGRAGYIGAVRPTG
jgi:cell wall-associated NlpC family hydrolase